MKPINFFLALAFLITASTPDKQTKEERVSKIINSEWTFNYFPSVKAELGYESPAFDDSGWKAVSIPHSWSTYETTGELHPFIRNASESDNTYWWEGWGWYRKHFSVNPATKGKKIFLEFEGVQKYCKVWINGNYLGDHKGGYSSFDFDITSYVEPGNDNVIAVAVNNSRKDRFRIPPMTAGNFDVYGGIYRDVTISLKNGLYIPMQGSASHEGGTFITTPGLTKESGSVRIQTWVKNDNKDARNCTLRTTIRDASGKTVQVVKSTASVKPGELYKFDQTSSPVKNPRLWSPEDPYIYTVLSEVIDGKMIVDNLTSPLGFRWFRWDYNENKLYVNDKMMLIHGGNRHQEYPWLGDAIPKWVTEMDFNDMGINLNYNFMRTVHYPNDKYVYDLTDKLGIVIDEEVPNIKNLDFADDVQIQQLREMIRRDRNHPSIMIWSMGNETNKAVDSKYAIEEDTTRILTARRVTNGSQGKYVHHSEENLAIENLLRCTIRGWYNKDVKNLEPDDQQHCGTEEHQMNMLKESGRFGKENLCTWLYEDHGADREYLNSPLLHVNPKGYVDVYRVPKYAYYFWQASYYETPMVFILPHFWRSQYLGQKKDITVTSNCDKIELKVNGISKGILNPDESNFHTVTFRDIIIEQGTITATGLKNGTSATTQVTMASDPAKIVLTSSHAKISADRASVAIIRADITDAKGNHVYGANNTLRWTVSGPATLVGPEIYESDIDKHHEMEGVWYMDVPVSNVIRSTGEKGKVKVTVSSGGLVAGAIDIESEELVRDNSQIIEPVLKNEGRNPVVRNVLENKIQDETPVEIKTIFGDLKFNEPDWKGYKKTISDYILNNNPGVDTTTVEFKALSKLLASYLFNNDGMLIADDYNFNADHFNKCRLIAGNIAATKLPLQFKDGLREFYAGSIITKGNEKNAGEEKSWLNGIPSEGIVVNSDETRLPDLIMIVNPKYSSFTDEEKKRVLEFVAKINPYIHTEVVSEADRNGKKNTITTFKAERRKPVLIPSDLSSITFLKK